MLRLQTAKKHLNIEDDYKEDDIYVMGLLQAAESMVRQHLQLDNEEDFYDEEGDIKDVFKQAILLLTGTWYQNRESVAYGVPNKLPHGYEYLLQTYKTYHF